MPWTIPSSGLHALVNSDQAYGLSDLVSSGFVRVVTHPRVFGRPTPVDSALSFVDALRRQPNRIQIDPRSRHWDIFSRLDMSVVKK